jgi:demethylmenaquinone methyltransferase/2-methoxy-6-polyprenyl-1,4-benzoquinol methylase
MFDRIAHRYDLLNRLLSGGTDVAWRKFMARHLPVQQDIKLLDLATGTADVMLALHANSGRVVSGVGVDPSGGMLGFGHKKIQQRGLEKTLQLVKGDAMRLALPDNHFDALSMAFGIRNVIDVDVALKEMVRVLKPGGRALILEFSLPANAVFRAVYLFYFRHILPRIGALLSGDSSAYTYLNKTVETFPYGQAFCDLMSNAGFENARGIPLTFGIATLYIAEKPGGDAA